MTTCGFPEGRLKSVEGLFSDGDVGNADWLVDPDGLGYENLILPDSSFEAEILETVLRGSEHCKFRITKNKV